jgi:hypothetical protein
MITLKKKQSSLLGAKTWLPPVCAVAPGRHDPVPDAYEDVIAPARHVEIEAS